MSRQLPSALSTLCRGFGRHHNTRRPRCNFFCSRAISATSRDVRLSCTANRWQNLSDFRQRRVFFSTKKDQPEEQKHDPPETPEGSDEIPSTIHESANSATTAGIGEKPEGPQGEDEVETLRQRGAAAVKKITELQDKYLRCLAEGENNRIRHNKELENTRQYGMSKFALPMLEVADNLTRALNHAEERGFGNETSDQDVRNEAAVAEVKQLVEGIRLTKNTLMNALALHNVEEYNPLNEQFDPNWHEALFEVPDPNTARGVITQVVKTGYTINKRVLRAAKVGTSRGS